MGFQPASNAFEKLLFNLAGVKYKTLVRIALNWNSIVGTLLSQRTEIVKYDNNILFVGVSNSVWLQELILRKPLLIKDIKKKTGISLKDIVFFIKS